MSPFSFNFFTGNLDIVGSGGGSIYFSNPVDTEASLPATDVNGVARVARDTDFIYIFDGDTNTWRNTGLKSTTFGSTPNTSGYTVVTDTDGNIVSTSIVLQPADATNPGGVSTSAQTLAGEKTFQDGIKASSIKSSAGNIINIGESGDTVNIYGSLNSIQTTNTEVTDKLVTLNVGGVAASAGGAGIEFEEDDVITGYNKVSADRNSLELKAPNTAGIATITPGVSGITLDQSSHNPVTVLDSNSIDLSLSTQEITADLKLSSTLPNADNQAVQLIVETDGLRAQIADSNIQSVISVSDTNSVDLTYSSGEISADVNISTVAADAGNTAVALDIQTDGIRAQIAHATELVEGSVNTTTQTFAGEKTFTTTPKFTAFTTAGVVHNAVDGSLSTSLIVDADIDASAVIGRSKIATGTANHVIINSGTGELSSESQLAVSRGGTGFDGTDLTAEDIILGSSSTALKRLPVGVEGQTLGVVSGVVAWKTLGTNSDIQPSSFSVANNQVSPSDITGFLFDNTDVRGFEAFVTVEIDATADLYEAFKLTAVNTGTSWYMSQTGVGDDSGVDFNITNAGQLQYTSQNYSGFVSGTIRFRANALNF